MSDVHLAITLLDEMIGNVSKAESAAAAALLGRLIRIKAALVEVNASTMPREFGIRHAISADAIRHGSSGLVTHVIDDTSRRLWDTIIDKRTSEFVQFVVEQDPAAHSVIVGASVALHPVHPTRRMAPADVVKSIQKAAGVPL